MSGGLSIVLIALGGLLLGGSLSVRKQRGTGLGFVVLIVLSLLALAGGVLWQFGEE